MSCPALGCVKLANPPPSKIALKAVTFTSCGIETVELVGISKSTFTPQNLMWSLVTPA